MTTGAGGRGRRPGAGSEEENMAKGPERPNILLLFTDQQRFDTIAGAGFEHMVTPNLDRLARDGCVFTNAFTPNPVCVPARHNLMTGLPARYHGYTANNPHPLDHRLPTLPQILSDNGWHTRAIGKMHFQPPRRHSGFDKMELMEEIPRYREDDEYAMYLKANGWGHIQNIHGVRNLLYMLPQRSLIPEEHHGSTWVGKRSAEFIRTNAGRRPFFLWSSWIQPHPPFDITDSVAELYKDRALPAPLVSETPLGPQAANAARYADFPEGEQAVYNRRMRECYYAAVSLVDKNVGVILDALEETGQLDNTLIMFTSDHGEMLGDHSCYQKMMPYDSAAHIPFVVRYPERVAPGSVRDDFVGLNDILPTVLDVGQLAYPGPLALPGQSALAQNAPRPNHYMEYGRGRGRWISVRTRTHKYNYYYRGGYEELFDLANDPCESRNLLICEPDDPAVADARGELRRTLIELESRWGLENYAAQGELLSLGPDAPGRKTRSSRNGQFPAFPSSLTDAREKESMKPFGEEVLEAVSNEPIVKLHDLDLDAWAANGAPETVIERIRREQL